METLTESSRKEIGLADRISSYSESLKDDGNEAQTRFHVIDEFLVHEIGWQKSSIKVEPYIEGAGYADYSLNTSGRCRIILEAKRNGTELCSLKQDDFSVVPLSSSALKGAASGVSQAIGYAARMGSALGAVTNGHQWILFRAYRGDGKPPQEGLAVVFSSSTSLINSWTHFYDFMSEIGLEEHRLLNFLQEKESGTVPIRASYFKAFDRSYKRVPQTSDLAFTLSELFRRSFIRINTKSKQALIECFVETRASREADVAFEKIVNELIDRAIRRLDSIDASNPDSLQGLIEQAVELRIGEFVLLVGNKGSGKTTFLNRFFSKILPASLKDRVINLGVDLLKSEGSDLHLTDWISNELIQQSEQQLFGTTPTFDQLRGAFWRMYTRMRSGELAPLYQRDPDAFRQKFGEELSTLRRDSPREYLLGLLTRALGGEHRLPIIIFDNVDHLPRDTQDIVFQYAVGISSSVASFLICPVTDTTVWSLSKAGPLQSFHSRAFFLPVPSLKDVFAKRLHVLKSELRKPEDAKPQSALVGKGMNLTIANAESFCAAVESIFVSTSDITAVIGRLCNYDVRRSLELSGEILSSPWIGLEELLRMYVAKGDVRPKRTALITSLVLQNGTIFDEDKHNFLINVFSRPAGTLTSPFLALYLIRYLTSVDEKASTTRDRFVSISQIWDNHHSLGIHRDTFRYYIDRLFFRNLIEAYDPSERTVREETLIRVSPAGSAHARLVFSDNVYLSQMALVTSIADEITTLKIREEAQKDHPGWLKICNIFLTSMKMEDKRVFPIISNDLYPWIISIRDDIDQLHKRIAERREIKNNKERRISPRSRQT
ncbi:AAA family ATPase [Luteimonas sp. RC10]|uniref:AAA family ATPase n=1 Tax=Luteimonas sp. RC10 TaxID=2587035 RepID=UPI00160FFDF3|nr:AAA family ATPase [Luteimonas sp. RC10]MBB3343184.1 energy-coupling factor transporter ATP-binding protein EcfA2 [Luteimonas sp. RC10]